jgi:hypothetical protein
MRLVFETAVLIGKFLFDPQQDTPWRSGLRVQNALDNYQFANGIRFPSLQFLHVNPQVILQEKELVTDFPTHRHRQSAQLRLDLHSEDNGVAHYVSKPGPLIFSASHPVLL